MNGARLLVLILAGCGFPNPIVVDASADSTIDTTLADAPQADVSDTGSADATGDAPVSTGCKSNMDCAKTCTGKTPMPCGCQAYLADSAPPNCDSSCQLTGCLNKTAVCTDAGTCIIQ